MSEQPIGSEVAGYRIESVIGRGGMAVVYRAEDMRLGRKVALKLLSPALCDEVRFQQRFVQESRLAASLDHPNIIPIYEAGNADGRLFIAMRYVVGHDLKVALSSSEPMGPSRTLRLFAQIGDALDAAHERGLVHRDVKPGNVLLAASQNDDHVYLTDFGLTKRVSAGTGGLTGTGHFLGTIDYVAPEQIAGKPVDARTDIYALGCVLYECLTGRVPFARDDDAATLWAHLADMPPPVSATRSDTAPMVDAVIARAMAKSPDDRYSSCHDLVSELREAFASATVSGAARRVGAVETAPSGLDPRRPREPEPVVLPPADEQQTSGSSEHPSFPPGTFPPVMSPRPARPAAHRAWEPEDDSEFDPEPEFEDAADLEEDPAVEPAAQWLDTDAYDDAEQAAPYRRSGRDFARTHRWKIVAVLVALAGLVTAAAVFFRPSSTNSATPLQRYASGNDQFQGLPAFALNAPKNWAAHTTSNTEVVLTPGGDAVTSLFASSSTAVGALLQNAPATVTGLYVYENEIPFNTDESWQSLQVDVANRLLNPIKFDTGYTASSVGNMPTERMTGQFLVSGGRAVQFVMDVVGISSAGSTVAALVVFFAAPADFAAQQHLFDQVRRSIVFHR